MLPLSELTHTVGQATESTLTFLFQLIAITSGAVKRDDVVTLFDIPTNSRNVKLSIPQGKISHYPIENILLIIFYQTEKNMIVFQ